MDQDPPQPSALTPRPSPVRVKICGITNPDDARDAVAAGADWIGLNFHHPSPRWIDPVSAATIVSELPATTQAVGLFVNRPPREVLSVAMQVGLSIVQLHGEEPPEDLPQLQGLFLIRAFRLADVSSLARMDAYLRRAEQLGRVPDAVLVDAHVAGLPGGTGRSIPDEVLDRLPPLPRLILAGGLTPENVEARIARVRPWMVDVAGGVESAPGRKDRSKVIAFVREARRSLATSPSPITECG